MDGELERYHKTNSGLDLLISNLKLKQSGLQGEVLTTRKGKADAESALRRIQHDLQQVGGSDACALDGGDMIGGGWMTPWFGGLLVCFVSASITAGLQPPFPQSPGTGGDRDPGAQAAQGAREAAVPKVLWGGGSRGALGARRWAPGMMVQIPDAASAQTTKALELEHPHLDRTHASQTGAHGLTRTPHSV